MRKVRKHTVTTAATDLHHVVGSKIAAAFGAGVSVFGGSGYAEEAAKTEGKST